MSVTSHFSLNQGRRAEFLALSAGDNGFTYEDVRVFALLFSVNCFPCAFCSDGLKLKQRLVKRRSVTISFLELLLLFFALGNQRNVGEEEKGFKCGGGEVQRITRTGVAKPNSQWTIHVLMIQSYKSSVEWSKATIKCQLFRPAGVEWSSMCRPRIGLKRSLKSTSQWP